MRCELEKHFLRYACLFGTRKPVRSFKHLEDESPDFYIYFADRIAGYVHEWRLDGGDTAIIGHFAVGKDLMGMSFGESLIRGFANALQREKGVKRILFRERTKRPDAALFQRLGATLTGRIVDGIDEWEWVL